jgi:hypothetical protein
VLAAPLGDPPFELQKRDLFTSFPEGDRDWLAERAL